MLTTLLSIGRTLREQPGAAGKKHHRYIRPLPVPDKKKKDQFINCYEVAVADDMTFDLSSRERINQESVLQDDLYFLNYKTSSADTMKKYVFGDICRFQNKVPKEEAFAEAEVNFTLGTVGAKPGSAYQMNSFYRAKSDAENMGSTSISAFRSCLEGQMQTLLELFESEHSVYINFRFGAGRKHWYEMDAEMKALDAKMLKEFVDEAPRGYVLSKSLHKTLSADKGAMPQFSETGAFKTWTFSTLDDVSDLLYSIDFSQKALIRKGEIKIVVLPRSEENGINKLTPQQIVNFFKSKGEKDIAENEDKISHPRKAELEDDEDEDEDQSIVNKPVYALEGDETTLALLKTKNEENITQFDFIFSKASSSPSTPDIDVIELAGVQKSRIQDLHDQIERLNTVLLAERDEWFYDRKIPLKYRNHLRILDSFDDVIGDVGRDKKKYSSHLLKVLPQIYCGSYIQDDLLLPAFIEVIERQIRDGSRRYDYLRFELFFLFGLQDFNRNEERKIMASIRDSKSYKAGQILGKMARPLRPMKDSKKTKIASFEKNYVGLISRRVTNLNELIELQNFINSKLTMHRVAYPDLKSASVELTKLIVDFDEKNYISEECVFGFFEGYYTPFNNPKEEDNESDENDESDVEQNDKE